jgi:hypothetical protein
MTEPRETYIDIHFDGPPPRDILQEWQKPFAGQNGTVEDLGDHVMRFRAESISPVFAWGQLFLERPGAQIAVTQQKVLKVLTAQGEVFWER